MPIKFSNWNFVRCVAACNDQKSWLSDNPQVGTVQHAKMFVVFCLDVVTLPQVEDGRDGGNPDFEDGVSDQYEDEVRTIVCMQCLSIIYKYIHMHRFTTETIHNTCDMNLDVCPG